MRSHKLTQSENVDLSKSSPPVTKTLMITENMKHSLNREILGELVMRKLRNQFKSSKMPNSSRLMLLSKVVTTDIISSFQVLSFFKNERIYCSSDLLSNLSEQEFPTSTIKQTKKEQVEINFAFYENEMLRKFQEAEKQVARRKKNLDKMRWVKSFQ